jgi:3-hydroxyacyl-[acyl-carrier-protein] dehydratase
VDERIQKVASRAINDSRGSRYQASFSPLRDQEKSVAKPAWHCYVGQVAMRFFLIDRISRWEVGSQAEGIKNVALSEDFFDDHFPRRPVMPGVLLLEGMAQLSGLLLEASLKKQYDRSAKAVLTVLERTKFRAMVKPGDSLLYRAELMSLNEAGGKTKASATRAGKLIASTEMVFGFKYIEDPLLDEKRQRLMDLWLQ